LIILVKIPVPKLISWAAFFFCTTGIGLAGSFPSSGPTVPGNEARLRGSLALAPANAPVSVKRAIWAANQLRTKPYRYGGGHRSFHDSAYDCSATVSYALAGAGLVSAPLSSKELRAYGSRGRGKWITVYARNGHAFAVIAGLRLDTTSPHNLSALGASRAAYPADAVWLRSTTSYRVVTAFASGRPLLLLLILILLPITCVRAGNRGSGVRAGS